MLTVQPLRLAGGLVLFAYVTSHLANHAVGILSLQAAESARLWFVAFWRHPIATWILYTSLVGHVGLALWAIFGRRTLRLPAWELIRLSLGLLIPLQLIQHIVNTRLIHEFYGVQDTYARQMLIYWVTNPTGGYQQLTLFFAAWIHGCIGVYYWIRSMGLGPGRLAILQILAVLLPLLALLGYVVMGMRVAELADDLAWVRGTQQSLPAAMQAELAALREGMLRGWIVLAVVILVGRPVRKAIERRQRGSLRVTYPSGRVVTATIGTSVLEVSRNAGIPHAAVCGGRGRCSTCRIRVRGASAMLPLPSSTERAVLERVGAPSVVRLACQLRPLGDVSVFPLFPTATRAALAAAGAEEAVGREQDVVVMFADLRAFTRFAEDRLAFDVVFVLNEYVEVMGRAIEANGGYVDKVVGDGIMALFGLDAPVDEGCRSALMAAAAMGEALETLNRSLQQDLSEPLRMGIGIHVGHAIVGEVGHGERRSLTAIGDMVNIASRLEGLTKELGSELVISEAVGTAARLRRTDQSSSEVDIRGRSDGVSVLAYRRAADVRADLEAST